MKALRIVGVASLSLALLGLGALHAVESGKHQRRHPAETRATMQELSDALQEAFLHSLTAGDFAAPKNKKTIGQALGRLDEQAGFLEEHGLGLDDSYAFMRLRLAEDVGAARRSFEAGEHEKARYLLHNVTENCFACHSRRPGAEVLLGSRFTDPRIDGLPFAERVKYLAATRQFESALEEYEAELRSVAPLESVGGLSSRVEDYLKLVLRVRENADRPLSTLAALKARPGLPAYLVSRIASWESALHALRRVRGARGLRRARELIRAAEQRNEFPADKRGTVHFIAASAELHQFIQSGPEKRAERAEAYYLLGVAESHLSFASWVSETDFFLEQAIRVDPALSHARKAFAFLEEYTLARYSGSSGTHLPASVWANLEELRELVAGAQ